MTEFVVQRVINGKLAFRDRLQPPSRGKRNDFLPLVDSGGRSGVTKGSRDLRTGAEIFDSGLRQHDGRAYSMLESKSKDAVETQSYASSCMETMGQRIRRLRDARGWTQGELAELVGVTLSAVSQWETDLTENVKLLPFLRLAKVFETDPYYLVFGNGRGAAELSRPVSVRPGKDRPKP